MAQTTRDLAGPAGSFYSLTPERVLDAVARVGQEPTGLCFALNSLENRVYEVELEDRQRVVAKFYRPGRWSRDTILDEHRVLRAIADAEIPTCPPLLLPSGSTLEQTPEGIYVALFPRLIGRGVDELAGDDYHRLGQLIGRIHVVTAQLGLRQRPEISPATYGRQCLATLVEQGRLPPALKSRFQQAAQQLIALAEARWGAVETFVVHGDCHRGNLLAGRDGWFFLDFDDCGVGPAVQDLWLLLPARIADCWPEVEAALAGYEKFREFPRESLGLVEALRGLRYLRYAAWIATRWDDPSFQRAFPDFGSERYWEQQVADLHEQIEQLTADR